MREALDDGPTPDVITLAGSGEPTLYGKLGDLIEGLRALRDIPILLITNSSLLWKPKVASAVNKVDILAPSLDAGDEATYQKVNGPHPSISFEKVFQGLKAVTHFHPGEIHLEVMIIDRVNDDEKSLRAIAKCIEALRVDRIDINTPVRPPMPGRGALPADKEALARAQKLFGPLARPIGRFENRSPKRGRSFSTFSDRDKDIREMLLRRPSTIDDIVAALSLSPDEIRDSLKRLVTSGLVHKVSRGDTTYFHVSSTNPTILEK